MSGDEANSRKVGGRSIREGEAEPSRSADPSQGQSSSAVRVYPPLTSYRMLPGRAGQTGSGVSDGPLKAARVRPSVSGTRPVGGVPGGRPVRVGRSLESLSGGPCIGTPHVTHGLSLAVRSHPGGVAPDSSRFRNCRPLAWTRSLSGTELPQGLPGTVATVEPPLTSETLRFSGQVPVQHKAERGGAGKEVRQASPSLVGWLKGRPQGLLDRVEVGAPPHSAQGDSLGECSYDLGVNFIVEVGITRQEGALSRGA
jgi:hypothetical protein